MADSAKTGGRAGRLQTLRSASTATSRPMAFAGGPATLGRTAELLDAVEPTRRSDDVILAPDTAKTLLDVVDEYRHADLIKRHHIPLRTKLLLYGPPGCGKSLTAEVLAREVGLPFLTVKLDAVVGSLLGETAANLRRVFEAAERQPMVLFLDEFDALGRSRVDPTEHSEMRRVVNNLLLFIERFHGRGFVVAATNLESSIDPAIMRRFDELIYLGPPTQAEIRRLVRLKTKNFPADVDIVETSKRLEGRTYADVERICHTAMRRAVIGKRKTISSEDFQYAVEADERRRGASEQQRLPTS